MIWHKSTIFQVANAAGLKKRREKMEVARYPSETPRSKTKIGLQFFAKPAISKLSTYYLPKDEYAHVMSELATNLTEEEKMLGTYSKRIGNSIYTVVYNGNLDFRVIGKKVYDTESGDYIDSLKKRTD